MRALWSLVIVVALSSVARAQLAYPPPAPKSPRIAALEGHLAKHERGAEDAFWKQLATEGAPIVEDVHEPGKRLVTFVWHGTAATRSVAVIGPIGPAAESWLERVPGSNVFAKSVLLDDRARLLWSIVVDRDPLKPGSLFDEALVHHDPLDHHPYDPMSGLLTLPNAAAQPYLVAHRETPAGTLWRHTMGARKLFVYTPPGYTAKGPAYPLLVQFDAGAVLTQMALPLALDELIAAKKIPPVVAVIIDNVDRRKDMIFNDAFEQLVALDIVPWVRTHYHATTDPRRTVISGDSLAGLVSAEIALHHSDVVGNVIAQSGAFWQARVGDEPEATSREIAAAPRVPVRFWIEAGALEGGGGAPDRTVTHLAANRHVRDVLRARGYDVAYREYIGTHTFAVWRGTIADGLIAMFATPRKLPAAHPAAVKRAPLEIGPAVPSSIASLTRTALLDGGDAALAAAQKLVGADAHALDEDDVDAVASMVLTLDHAKDATPLYRWNTERFPRSASAWGSLGWVYFAAGDRTSAVACFKRQLAIAPHAPVVEHLLADLAVQP